MSKHEISFRLNGESYKLEVDSNKTLLELIRDDLELTGTKKACERGDCGLCTVLLDGEPVKSCLVLAVEANGREITTIEGISIDERLAPLQKSFIKHHAAQCGFCTPAFILVGTALLAKNPHPTEEEVKEAMSSVLCRCTGYRQIIDAILDASTMRKKS